jgi:flavorubredoxin
MHDPIEIAKNIYWIGVNDYETDLFEAQWPLPEGVSYNSYLIAGDKTVLIDTVKKTHLSQYVRRSGSLPRRRDHRLPGHQPHGARSFRCDTDHEQLFPEMNIVGNKKTIDLVKEFYGITTA